MPPPSYCNLPKPARCSIRTAQTNVLRAPGNYSDAGFRHLLGCVRRRAELHFASSQDEKLSRTCWAASERNYSIAGFRKLMGCIRHCDHLLSRAARVLRSAPCFQLLTHQNFRAAAPPNRREFAIARPAISSLSNDVFASGSSWVPTLNSADMRPENQW